MEETDSSQVFTGSPVAYCLALKNILSGTEAASFISLSLFVRPAFVEFSCLRAAILTRHYLAKFTQR